MKLTLLSGREVIMHTAEDAANFTGYDNAMAQIQVANCGYFITDCEWGDVLDDDFELSEFYEIVEDMKAKNQL